MSDDEIISMAREVGMVEWPFDGDCGTAPVWDLTKESLTAFAALVSARAAKDEREAIKAIADRQTQYYFERATEAYGLSEERFNMFHAMKEAAQFIGEQIDERGDQHEQ